MTQQASLEQSYLALIKFLMLSKRRIMELGAQNDMSGMQAMTIFLLDCPRPMNSFKKVFNCDASNVTGLVDGLEHKNLASRYENAADRRIKMVKLTPTGERMRTSLISDITVHENPLLSRLSNDELTTFITLLEKITKEVPAVNNRQHD